MRRSNRGATAPSVVLAAAFALWSGCDFGAASAPPQRPDLAPPPAPPGMEDMAQPPPAPSPDLATPGEPPIPAAYEDPQLAARRLDHSLALRTASLKLTGELPTSDEQLQLAAAPDRARAYAARVDAYLADPRFVRQMLIFFRNAFRAGGAIPGVSLETAATFAAQLVVEDRPFTEVLTAEQGTCPKYTNGAFVPANCTNGVPKASGVLTDPGVQALFTSNMAFRRARWVQETFACGKFPAEFRDPPLALPPKGALYTAPWPFESIAGAKNGGAVDFLAAETLVCANCHATLNHVAPLFARFDEKGVWQNAIQVATPIMGLPKSVPGDWLPMNEGAAWRFGVPVADIPALGRAIAADQDRAFSTCMATRVYDFAMSKEDPVDGGASVPPEVIAPYREAFVAGGGFKLKAAIRLAFTSDDFVRF